MTHEITIVPAQKMDSYNLFQAVCSCGEYRSRATSKAEASRSGTAHKDSKNQVEGS